MIDFGKTVNIVFTAVCAALFVFLLVSAIAVVAKGKRKCSVFDVILRIVSSLCLVISAGLFACAVLTVSTGSVRIDVSDAPVFIAGGSETALPLPDLFATLSASLGAVAVVALFVLSLITLVADCLIANKKDGESSAAAQKGAKKRASDKTAKAQSPEQARRIAELEKIRRIGDSAVKKTNAAATHADSTSSAPDNGRAEADHDENSAFVSDDKVLQSSDPTEMPSESDDAIDWRTEKPTERHSEFIGITENADPDFDSFDAFDEADEADEADEVGEEYEASGENYPEDGEASQETEQIDDDGYFAAVDGDEEQEPQEAETAEDREELWEAEKAENDEDFAPTDDSEDVAEAEETEDDIDGDGFDEPMFGTAYSYETEESAKNLDDAYADDEYADIEPNRDIYIPKVRTIVRAAPSKTAKSSAKGKNKKTGKSSDSSTAKKADGGKAVGAKTAAKSGAKSTAAAKERNSGIKAVAAKKPSGNVRAATASPEAKAPSKRLPVPRRYVIIDRKSAVNVFSEYLKDRDAAEKRKLEASINTIIIK